MRHGKLSLLAGIDLLTGEVISSVEERHRSRKFVDFLTKLEAHYQPELRIQIVLDNHSAHISKETKAYLATLPIVSSLFLLLSMVPGSINIIEVFFAKMTKQVLRHIRVESKAELKQRIERYLQEVNQNPTPFRWKHAMED